MKNFILKTTGIIAAIVMLICAAAIDSDSNIPFIVGMISGIYLLIFIHINKEYFEGGD